LRQAVRRGGEEQEVELMDVLEVEAEEDEEEDVNDKTE
jgi:hypothetical protein